MVRSIVRMPWVAFCGGTVVASRSIQWTNRDGVSNFHLFDEL